MIGKLPGLELNYLFHGMNEHQCRKKILTMSGNIDAVFFPLNPIDADISHLFYEQHNPLSIDLFNSVNFNFPLKALLNITTEKAAKDTKNIKFTDFLKIDKTKYIILEAVHITAHAHSDTAKFYTNLLSTCNYHSLNNGINFIISCVRIPVVFHKENPLRHMWEFVDCTPATDQNDVDFINSLNFLTDSTSPLPPEIYERIKERIIIKSSKSITSLYSPQAIIEADPDVRNVIQGVSESLSLYRSDLYLPNTHNPVTDESANEKIDELLDEIVGQQEAAQKLVDKVKIFRNPADWAAAKKEKKPLGVFLFVGPSGVGKTHLSQKLAEKLPDYRFLQINLGEHQDRDSVNKLIGVGRGYVDSDLGGILTEPVRLHSKYVLLFDELDQAHKSVGQLFYKIFEGEVTDGRGRKVSFADCYIIMTTNAGARTSDTADSALAAKDTIENVPLKDATSSRQEIENKLIEVSKVERTSEQLKFTDAFLGRIYDIIHFNPLSISDLAEIARRHFNNKIRNPYKKVGISIDFELNTAELGTDISMHLVDKGILDTEILFFEMFAVLAGHNNSQGARRLLQQMDEHLIHPLETARIECRGDATITISQIQLKFKPVLDKYSPNFDRPSIVIIDDMEDDVVEIRNHLEDIADAKVCSFDFEGVDILTAQVVLLDLYNGTERIPVDDYLAKIRQVNEHVPVILHSSLKHSPLRGQLRNEHWKTGTFGYLIKGESTIDDIRKLVSRAIHAYHASFKTSVTFKNFFVIRPDTYATCPLKFEFDYEKNDDI